jgi:DNA-binding XRE family transcriptional regulator
MAKRNIRGVSKTNAAAQDSSEQMTRYRLGGKEFVTMDARAYDALAAAAEDAEDARLAALSAAAADDDLIPGKVVHRIVRGEIPLRVWREHRGLKAVEVARRADINQSYYSQLESGKREGSLTTLARLAAVLDVLVDDLVPANSGEKDLNPR